MKDGMVHKAGDRETMRKLVGSLVLLGLLTVLLGLAVMIPYYYQSQSILYKFGSDKVVLRLGKVAGLLAAVLLMAQVISASRIQYLETLVSKKALYRFHQIAGTALVLMALIHPLMVFWPEELRSLAVEWQYWPEAVGAFLLILLWLVFLAARLRRFLGFSGLAWLKFHRILVNLAVMGVLVHTMNVSDTFEKTVPRTALLGLAGIYVAVWLRLRIVLFLQAQKTGKRKSVLPPADAADRNSQRKASSVSAENE